MTNTGILPLFLNWRTAISFFAGCGMVPVVGFLDYSHGLDGPWLGENDKGLVFTRWWYGTNGDLDYFVCKRGQLFEAAHLALTVTPAFQAVDAHMEPRSFVAVISLPSPFFPPRRRAFAQGVFLESPWPFVIMWSLFGFASWFTTDNTIEPEIWQILMLVNCVLQGVDAGIPIQQNLYAGNIAGKKKFSKPIVLRILLLAVNAGQNWGWTALALTLPGTIFIILGQKTVFGARRRGDFTSEDAETLFAQPAPPKTLRWPFFVFFRHASSFIQRTSPTVAGASVDSLASHGAALAHPQCRPQARPTRTAASGFTARVRSSSWPAGS